MYRNLAPVSSSSWSHQGVTEFIVRHTSSRGRTGLVKISNSLVIVCLLTKCIGGDYLPTRAPSVS